VGLSTSPPKKICVENDVGLKRDILEKQIKKDFKVAQLYLDVENNLRELEVKRWRKMQVILKDANLFLRKKRILDERPAKD
jgi:hypothetical protein